MTAFGADYKEALKKRTEASPPASLTDMDMKAERAKLRGLIGHPPTEEEFVLYLTPPGDALKTFEFKAKYGDPNQLLKESLIACVLGLMNSETPSHNRYIL